MARFVAIAGQDVRSAQVAGIVLGIAPRRSWSDNLGFAVAVDQHVAIAEDERFVVAVVGRFNGVDGKLISGTGAARYLLGVWQHAGESRLADLYGDFAGIVFHRETRRLYALQDVVGATPLYLARWGSTFAAASELTALMRMPAASLEPNPTWVAAYLAGRSLPDVSQTAYSGVHRLLPGRVAESSPGGWRQRRYVTFRVPAYQATDDGRDGEHVRSLIDAAIRRRVPEGSAVAIALSGGLDSTSLTVSLRAVRPQSKIIALCMGIATPEGDERSIQRSVAGDVSADLCWLPLGKFGPFGNAPEEVFRRFGAPPVVTNWFLGDMLASAAHDAGLSMLIDGEDGDGLLAGNLSYLSDLIVRGRWSRWYREAYALRDRWGLPVAATLRRSLAPLPPPFLRRARWRRSPVPSYVSPAFAGLISLRRRPDIAWSIGREYRQTDATFRDDAGLMSLTFDTTAWFIERDVEIVRPLLDRELIEFCGSLPWYRKTSGGISKIVLRDAMRSRLPDVLLGRLNKADLSSIFRSVVTTTQRHWVVSGLQYAVADRNGIFMPTGLAELRAKLDHGVDLVTASRVALLAHWLRWLETATPASFVVSVG